VEFQTLAGRCLDLAEQVVGRHDVIIGTVAKLGGDFHLQERLGNVILLRQGLTQGGNPNVSVGHETVDQAQRFVGDAIGQSSTRKQETTRQVILPRSVGSPISACDGVVEQQQQR
jgi:hypothetical protein